MLEFDVFEQLQAFIKWVYSSDFCDKERVYLMGASMGGYATWQMAMSLPELFAAIVPICGGGMYWNAHRLPDVPVWAFHGDADTVVPPVNSYELCDRLKAAGGNVRLTVFHGVDHNSQPYAYETTNVIEWLVASKRT